MRAWQGSAGLLMPLLRHLHLHLCCHCPLLLRLLLLLLLLLILLLLLLLVQRHVVVEGNGRVGY